MKTLKSLTLVLFLFLAIGQEASAQVQIVRPVSRKDIVTKVNSSGVIDLTNVALVPQYFHILSGYQIKSGVLTEWHADDLPQYYRDSLGLYDPAKPQTSLYLYTVYPGLGPLPMNVNHVLKRNQYSWHSLSGLFTTSVDTVILSIIEYVP